MKIGLYVKHYRERYKLSMQEFADKADLSKGYISMLEKGKHPQNDREIVPSIETVNKIAKAMNLSIDELLARIDGNQMIDISRDRPLPSNIILPSAHKLPIMGTICAGDGVVCEDDYQGTFIVDIDVKADYCLRVRGDSMIGANIYDGDIVFISKSYDFVQDQIYAIERLDYNEASLKRVTQDGDTLILNPCNPEYHAMVTDYEEVRIIGRCVGVLHKYV